MKLINQSHRTELVRSSAVESNQEPDKRREDARDSSFVARASGAQPTANGRNSVCYAGLIHPTRSPAARFLRVVEWNW